MTLVTTRESYYIDRYADSGKCDMQPHSSNVGIPSPPQWAGRGFLNSEVHLGHCAHSYLGGQGSHLQCHYTKASDPRFHLHSKGFKGMVTVGTVTEAGPASPVGLHSWKANLHGTAGTIQHWAFVAGRLSPLSVTQNRIPAAHSCSPQL